MAIKTFVTGSSTATIADNDTTIVGGTAGNEKVKILSGVTGTNLDGNIEKVDLAGSLADYKFVFVAGTGFQVQTTSGTVVTTIASLNQAATVAFADGSAQLTQTGNASVTLGNQTIGTTLVATTATALGATFDTTVKSTINPTTSGTGQSFTLTTSSSDLLTGTTNNDTFSGVAGTTYQGTDIINDASSADSDTLNVTATGDVSAVPTIIGIESINYLVSSFANPTISVDNVRGGTVTVAQTQVSGATSATVTSNSVAMPVSAVKAGAGITGTLTVAGAASTGALAIDGGSASTVTQTVVTSGALSITANSATTINASGSNLTVSATQAAAGTTIVLTGTTGLTDTATVSATGLLGAVALTTNNTNAIETVNLSGNGAAAVFTLTGTPNTINVTGSQSVTVAGTAAQFSGKTFTDTSTGSAVSTIKVITTADTIDATNLSPDVIRLAVNMAGNQIDVKNGATVAVSVTDATGLDLNGPTATATTNSVTIQVDDFTAGLASSAIDLTTVDVTQIKNVALVVNDPAAAAGSFGSTTAVTASGAGTLTFTSAADSLNATGLTGVLTATASSSLKNITGGSASDTITAYAGAFTIDGGAGSADTLAIPDGQDLTGAAFTLSNIEVIQLDANSSATTAETSLIPSSAVSGKSYIVKGYTTADILNVVLDATTVDLSSLVVDSSTVAVTLTNTSVNILSQTITGSNANDTLTSAGAGAISFNAGAGADAITTLGGADNIGGGTGNDTINSGAGVDTIDGGAGDDALTAGSGADIITGGSGSDTVYFYNAIGTAATATNNSAGYASQVAGSDSIYLGASGTATDGSADHVQWAGAESGGYVATAASLANGLTSAIAGIKADGTKHIYGFDSSDVIEFKNGFLASSAGTAITNGTATAQLLDNTANFSAAVTTAASNPFIEITQDLNATQVAGGATSVAAFLTGTVETSMKVVFAIDDGTDSYLWYFAGSSTNATAIDAAELTLIGVVHGVTAFTAGDFAVIA